MKYITYCLTRPSTMDVDTEESIRTEITDIKAVPVAQRSEHHFKRLNELEAEIRRRRSKLQGKRISVS